MKKKVTLLLAIMFFAGSLFAQRGFEGRPITNNLFQPTGFTLHKGEFMVGLGPVYFGISENVQFGANILLFIFQYYNADLKVNFVNSGNIALAGGIGVGYLNLDLIGLGDANFTTLSPSVAFTYVASPKTNIHASVQYTHFFGNEDIKDAEAKSLINGTTVVGGIEYSFSERTKFLADVGYDATFDGVRLGGGVLLGWEKFRLKLGLGYYSADDGFVLPLVGLWWRFAG